LTTTILNSSKIAVVIFAQNESPVIKNTIDNIRRSLRISDSLYVIADNCSDDTPDIARSAGAQVLVRDFANQPGKGAAITWFLKTHSAQIMAYDYILILDADSLIPEDFFPKIDSQLEPRVAVAQCSILPTGFEESPIMAIIALSEIVEQIVFNNIRSFLGFSVRLRGTGMIFDPTLLISIGPKIGTEVEDIALSMLVAEQKIPVRWFKTVVVFDPKPGECTDATTGVVHSQFFVSKTSLVEINFNDAVWIRIVEVPCRCGSYFFCCRSGNRTYLIGHIAASEKALLHKITHAYSWIHSHVAQGNHSFP